MQYVCMCIHMYLHKKKTNFPAQYTYTHTPHFSEKNICCGISLTFLCRLNTKYHLVATA